MPRGYTINELLKSVKVKLNDNQGTFEYLTAVSGNSIQLLNKLVLDKANFTAEDYQTLRFFLYL